MSTVRTLSTPMHGLLERFSTREAHPPLYFLQLKAWHALHMRSLVNLRANSALWGTVSLCLVYLAARFYGGEPAGLLALGFLVFSPLHLAYSQEMRPYAMAMALGLAALLALEHRRWIALGLFWTALLYTHYWGAFVVLGQATYGLYTFRAKVHRKALAIVTGSAALLFAAWVPILWTQLGYVDGMAFWVPGFSMANLGKVFLAFTGIFFNVASWIFFLPTKVWVIALLGLLFTVALMKGLLQGRLGPVAWLVLGLLVPWLLSLWKPGIYLWYRYPVLMLPAFAILVALGVQTIKYVPVRVAIACVLIGSQVWGSWVYFHSWQKANPKAVVQYVHWLRGPDSVVVRPSYFSDLFSFYDQGTSVTLDENVFDSPEKRAALKGKKVILLAFDVPSDPVVEAFLGEFKTLSGRYFPGTAHLGITVYQLK